MLEKGKMTYPCTGMALYGLTGIRMVIYNPTCIGMTQYLSPMSRRIGWPFVHLVIFQGSYIGDCWDPWKEGMDFCLKAWL